MMAATGQVARPCARKPSAPNSAAIAGAEREVRSRCRRAAAAARQRRPGRPARSGDRCRDRSDQRRTTIADKRRRRGTAPAAASVRQAMASVAAVSSGEHGQRRRVVMAGERQQQRAEADRPRACPTTSGRSRPARAPARTAGRTRSAPPTSANPRRHGTDARRAHRRGCRAMPGNSQNRPNATAVTASQRHSRMRASANAAAVTTAR